MIIELLNASLKNDYLLVTHGEVENDKFLNFKLLVKLKVIHVL